MKCTYCGAPVEEGRIFCLKCGEEVVWVPDYNAIGSYRSQSEQAIKEATRRTIENEKKQQKEILAAEVKAAANEKKKRRKGTWIFAMVILLFLGIAGYFGGRYYIHQRNYNSFDHQQESAKTFFNNGEYDIAKTYVDRALELDPDNTAAIALKVDVLLGQGRKDNAIQTLLELTFREPANIEAYGKIIKLYEDERRSEKIKELLSACEDETVLSHFAAYIVEKPVVNLPSGEYNELSKVEIYPLRDVAEDIYYTLDGSTPTNDSILYTEAIELAEGATLLKAVAINDRHISSDIVEMTYVVELLPPAPPVISPSSGEFTTEMDNKIYINVPKACTAYYAFDERPTTSSTKYIDAVEMLEGQHTFYAILVDEHGKQSEPGTAFYNLVGETNVQNQPE